MKKYFIINCIFIFGIINAQTFLNNVNKQIIPNVTVLSKLGQVLGVSNKEGRIDFQNIESEFKLIGSDSIEIIHSNFDSQKITWKGLKDKPTILLEPINDIEEVILTTKNPEYLVLKAYYISYQLIDNEPQSFSDGIIEYYLSLTKNKIVDYNILAARIYKNIPVINNLYKRLGNTTLSIGSRIEPFNFYEEILLNRWNEFDLLNDTVIKLKDNVIGSIEKVDKKSNVFVEYYTPTRYKQQSLLGMSSKIENYNIIENFSSEKYDIKNLLKISKYYKSFITQKKVNFKYELIQNVQVLEKKFLSKEEFKNLKLNFNHSDKISYSQNYWEQESLMEIPFFIRNLLNNQLTLMK
ncbi:hypothetical protein AAH994_14135 [Weeksellaceae bacterium A-14]